MAQNVSLEYAQNKGTFFPNQPVLKTAPSPNSSLSDDWFVSQVIQVNVPFTLPAISSGDSTTLTSSSPLTSLDNPLNLLPTDTALIVANAVAQNAVPGILVGAPAVIVSFGSVIGPSVAYGPKAWTSLAPGLSYRNPSLIVSLEILATTSYGGGDVLLFVASVVLYGQTGTT